MSDESHPAPITIPQGALPIPTLPALLFGLTETQLRTRIYGAIYAFASTDPAPWISGISSLLGHPDFGLGTPVELGISVRRDEGGARILHIDVRNARSANKGVLHSEAVIPVAEDFVFSALPKEHQDAYYAAGVAKLLSSYLTGSVPVASEHTLTLEEAQAHVAANGPGPDGEA